MQMDRYEVAVFDVDGTLLDTTEGILAAVQYTIETHRLGPLSEGQLLRFIGPPIQDSFHECYGFTGGRLQELAETFRNRYKGHELLKAVPYEGIYNVFEALQNKGVTIAVATYKRQDYAVELLEHFHFDRYTDIMYGADNFNKLKKKDIILKCMDSANVPDCSRAVMVGDSDNDAVGAGALGMDFIGVTYGFGFRTESDVMAYPSIGHAGTPLDIITYFED